ncbi:MAG: hypothetical protein MRY79_07405 [Alphaproteobacteria bacterium]|nr:hypothetical protein [Alphaproteobacteria bacterium]
MAFETVLDKTLEYLSIPSVVGHEAHFTAYLAQDFEKLGLKTHNHKGLLEISGKTPHAQIISAHMDRHGLVSLGEGSYKYAAAHIREEKYGEENKPSKATLKAIGQRFEDETVFAYDPKTGEELGRGQIHVCETGMENGDPVFQITGMPAMSTNTPVAYARMAEFDGTYLKGQIDNVLSLGVIYALFDNGFEGTALLSTEEEIGKSWIHITDWLEKKNIETQNLFILDTSPYRYAEEIEEGMIVLRYRDKSGIFNAGLVEEITKHCTGLDLPFQLKDEYFLSLGLKTADLGSTELGRIVQNTDGRWNGASIQIPTLEYHTSYETASKTCIANYYALLENMLISR